YKADTEYPLPMIYQSGYLTIKEYERDMGLFLLDFPNNEVKGGFLTMVATNYLQCKTPLESWMMKAVFALKRGQLEEF
ncbi:AAA-ATPase, partial [gut metagenome]